MRRNSFIANTMVTQPVWLRVTCLAVSAIFIWSNILFAQRANPSFWEERRNVVAQFIERRSNNTITTPDESGNYNLLAQLPAIQTSLPVIASTGEAISKVPISPEIAVLPLATRNDDTYTNAITLKHNNPITPILSSIAPYAEIKEIHFPNAKTLKRNAAATPFIIHIQDVHENYEAQKNISSLISTIAPAMVGLEGSWGPLDLKLYRSFSNKKVTSDIVDYFLKEGFLSGPEHAGITMENDDVKLIGVEEKTLYQDHVKAFKEAVLIEKEIKERVTRLSNGLKHLKTVYPEQILELDKKISAYHKGELGLGEYLTYLSDTKKSLLHEVIGLHNISLFLATINLEKTIDFAKVENERKELIELLAIKLPKAHLDKLAQTGISYSQGEISGSQFYGYLQGVINTFLKQNYPDFSKYIRYISLADQIRPEKLFNEINAVEDEIFRKSALNIFQSKRILSVYEMGKDLILIEKLLSQSLTPDEWQTYKSRKTEINNLENRVTNNAQSPNNYSLFEKFFELAEARNQALVENLLKKMVNGNNKATPFPPSPIVVLVAGGFHTPGITSILRNKNVAFAVITPRLTKLEGKATDYLNVFRRGKTPLEKLFTGERLTLKAIQATHPASDFYPVMVRYFAMLELSVLTALSEEISNPDQTGKILTAKEMWSSDVFQQFKKDVLPILQKGGILEAVEVTKVNWNKEIGLRINYNLEWNEKGETTTTPLKVFLYPQEKARFIHDTVTYRQLSDTIPVIEGLLEETGLGFEVFPAKQNKLVKETLEIAKLLANKKPALTLRRALLPLALPVLGFAFLLSIVLTIFSAAGEAQLRIEPSRQTPQIQNPVTPNAAKDIPAFESLINDLESENLDVIRNAMESLGEIGDTEAVDPLIKILSKTYENWRVPAEAAKALGKIRDPKAIGPLLNTAFTHPDYNVRAYAHEVLGQFDHNLVLKTLKDSGLLPKKENVLPSERGSKTNVRIIIMDHFTTETHGGDVMKDAHERRDKDKRFSGIPIDKLDLDLYPGIEEALDELNRIVEEHSNDVIIVNLSKEGFDPLRAAGILPVETVKELGKKGVIFVVAAGNAGKGLLNTNTKEGILKIMPEYTNNVLFVAAGKPDGTKTDYSDLGPHVFVTALPNPKNGHGGTSLAAPALTVALGQKLSDPNLPEPDAIEEIAEEAEAMSKEPLWDKDKGKSLVGHGFLRLLPLLFITSLGLWGFAPGNVWAGALTAGSESISWFDVLTSLATLPVSLPWFIEPLIKIAGAIIAGGALLYGTSFIATEDNTANKVAVPNKPSRQVTQVKESFAEILKINHHQLVPGKRFLAKFIPKALQFDLLVIKPVDMDKLLAALNDEKVFAKASNVEGKYSLKADNTIVVFQNLTPGETYNVEAYWEPWQELRLYFIGINIEGKNKVVGYSLSNYQKQLAKNAETKRLNIIPFSIRANSVENARVKVLPINKTGEYFKASQLPGNLKYGIKSKAIELLKKAYTDGNIGYYQELKGMLRLAKQLAKAYGSKSVNLLSLYDTLGTPKMSGELAKLLELDNEENMDLYWNQVSMPYERLEKAANLVIKSPDKYNSSIGMLRLAYELTSGDKGPHLHNLFAVFGKDKVQHVLDVFSEGHANRDQLLQITSLSWPYVSLPYKAVRELAERVAKNEIPDEEHVRNELAKLTKKNGSENLGIVEMENTTGHMDEQARATSTAQERQIEEGETISRLATKIAEKLVELMGKQVNININEAVARLKPIFATDANPEMLAQEIKSVEETGDQKTDPAQEIEMEYQIIHELYSFLPDDLLNFVIGFNMEQYISDNNYQHVDTSKILHEQFMSPQEAYDRLLQELTKNVQQMLESNQSILPLYDLKQQRQQLVLQQSRLVELIHSIGLALNKDFENVENDIENVRNALERQSTERLAAPENFSSNGIVFGRQDLEFLPRELQTRILNSLMANVDGQHMSDEEAYNMLKALYLSHSNQIKELEGLLEKNYEVNGNFDEEIIKIKKLCSELYKIRKFAISIGKLLNKTEEMAMQDLELGEKEQLSQSPKFVENVVTEVQSVFGDEFISDGWMPVIGQLYWLSKTQAEVTRSLINSIRTIGTKMGLNEQVLEESITDILNADAPNQIARALVPFRANFGALQVVFGAVGLIISSGMQHRKFGKAITSVEAALGLQAGTFQTISGEVKGMEPGKFMMLTRKPDGSLDKIIIHEQVMDDNSNVLLHFLAFSYFHEFLESKGLTHEQVIEIGWGIEKFEEMIKTRVNMPIGKFIKYLRSELTKDIYEYFEKQAVNEQVRQLNALMPHVELFSESLVNISKQEGYNSAQAIIKLRLYKALGGGADLNIDVPFHKLRETESIKTLAKIMLFFTRNDKKVVAGLLDQVLEEAKDKDSKGILPLLDMGGGLEQDTSYVKRIIEMMETAKQADGTVAVAALPILAVAVNVDQKKWIESAVKELSKGRLNATVIIRDNTAIKMNLDDAIDDFIELNHDVKLFMENNYKVALISRRKNHWYIGQRYTGMILELLGKIELLGTDDSETVIKTELIVRKHA